MIQTYAVQADGGNIVSLDDQSVQKDLAALDGTGGSAFEAFILSTSFDDGGGGWWNTIRRAIQDVPHSGGVTVSVRPYRDGFDTGQTITRALVISDNPTVTVPLFYPGTVFQVRIGLTLFDAVAGLGVGAVAVVARRAQR